MYVKQNSMVIVDSFNSSVTLCFGQILPRHQFAYEKRPLILVTQLKYKIVYSFTRVEYITEDEK